MKEYHRTGINTYFDKFAPRVIHAVEHLDSLWTTGSEGGQLVTLDVAKLGHDFLCLLDSHVGAVALADDEGAFCEGS